MHTVTIAAIVDGKLPPPDGIGIDLEMKGYSESARKYMLRGIMAGGWMGHLDYCLYIIRDGDVIFYVGRSRDVVIRVLQHLGLSDAWGSLNEHPQWPDNIGSLVWENAPDSGLWQVDFLSVEDARDLTHYPYPNIDIQGAENALIDYYHPCVNVSMNHNPTKLPERYAEERNRRTLEAHIRVQNALGFIRRDG